MDLKATAFSLNALSDKKGFLYSKGMKDI